MMKYENIRKLRIDSGYTQKRVASYLNIRQNTYSQYEIGTTRYPLDAVVTLAEFYGVSVDYLVELTDDPKPYPRKRK